jgi:ketosteroid isomerase-like protein
MAAFCAVWYDFDRIHSAARIYLPGRRTHRIAFGIPVYREIDRGRLGQMNGEELMRTIVAAFEKSDLQPLLAALHDDVVWKSASRHDCGPFSFKGDYKNKEGVLVVLSKISKDYTFFHMKPKDITACNDLVWGLFDVEARYDAKGRDADAKNVQLDMAIRWRLKDGKIIEHQAFFDTAYLLTQQQP